MDYVIIVDPAGLRWVLDCLRKTFMVTVVDGNPEDLEGQTENFTGWEVVSIDGDVYLRINDLSGMEWHAHIHRCISRYQFEGEEIIEKDSTATVLGIGTPTSIHTDPCEEDVLD